MGFVVRLQLRRARTIIATGAVALAALGALSACESNVGVAARIDGHTISETQVSDYVTPQAQAFSQGQQDGTTQRVDARPFVLSVLISLPLYTAILDRTPGGAPSADRLDALVRTSLGNKSATALVRRGGARGYTDAFSLQLIRLQVLSSLISQRIEAGANITTILKRLQFPVSVNPRYGTWNAKTLTLESSATSGLPDYLKLQSGGTG